jgi:adenosylcobyric acid synthase
LLVGDIERGGVFAQIVGTWSLLDPADRARGLGVVVNKFRGDLSLFAAARQCLAGRIPLPYLGVLPFSPKLQPESEDSLCQESEERGEGDTIAWIRFPHLSNSQDCQPWLQDRGVRVRWIQRINEVEDAKLVVLPGSKNTVADLQWLRETGIETDLKRAAQRGIPIVGICAGYQMLGESVGDRKGVAGDAGILPGLNLLPVRTTFSKKKEVRQVFVSWRGERWQAYEIHMGETMPTTPIASCCWVESDGGPRPEGCQVRNVWGTYLHGLFESAAIRSELASRAGFSAYRPSTVSWREHLQSVYDGMADLLQEHLKLEEVWDYVAH